METVLVLFSANSEWKSVLAYAKPARIQSTPFGEFFQEKINGLTIVFVKGGWGKISAAASAQYGIQRWQPDLVINLGTCGGFEGRVERGTIVLVEQTVVYDIFEQMGVPEEALAFYSTDLDLSWLKEPYPQSVQRGRLISADRDILPEDVDGLVKVFNVFAADWESGAIAWVCRNNGVQCLILRGVSDLVNANGGEVYGDIDVFHRSTQEIINSLLDHLPEWILCCRIL